MLVYHEQSQGESRKSFSKIIISNLLHHTSFQQSKIWAGGFLFKNNSINHYMLYTETGQKLKILTAVWQQVHT